MKHFITCWILCAQVALVSAQYAPLISDVTYHYSENSSSYIRAIAVAEATVTNESVTYRPFRMLYHNVFDDCRYGFSQHWIGNEIVHNLVEGVHQFNHVLGYTVRIEYNQPIGQEWIVSSSPFDIRGKVISYDEETFLGVTDSVKTIEFTRYDENLEIDQDSPWTGATIKLSKNNGYLQVLPFGRYLTYDPYYDPHHIDFGSFDLIGRSDLPDSYQNLLWREVIDLSVGDELHISRERNDYTSQRTFEKQEIVSKWSDGQTQYYEALIAQRSIVYNYFGELERDTLIEKLDTLSWPLDNPTFDLMSDQPYFTSTDSLELTNNTAKDDLFGSSKIVALDLTVRNYADSICWLNVTDYEHQGWCTSNAGGPYYAATTFEGYQQRLLRYFKSDAIEVGSPLDSIIYSAVRPEPIPTSWKISPNPFSDKLELDFGGDTDPKEIRIYSIDGRLQFENKSNDLVLSTANWSPGLYIVKVVSNKDEYFHKVLKN